MKVKTRPVVRFQRGTRTAFLRFLALYATCWVGRSQAAEKPAQNQGQPVTLNVWITAQFPQGQRVNFSLSCPTVCQGESPHQGCRDCAFLVGGLGPDSAGLQRRLGPGYCSAWNNLGCLRCLDRKTSRAHGEVRRKTLSSGRAVHDCRKTRRAVGSSDSPCRGSWMRVLCTTTRQPARRRALIPKRLRDLGQFQSSSREAEGRGRWSAHAAARTIHQ